MLTDIRKRAKLTQAQVGEKLGLAHTTYQRWEAGAVYPKKVILYAMVYCFDPDHYFDPEAMWQEILECGEAYDDTVG